MGKAVEEADDHQNQRVRHHDGLVAQLVDDAANDGGGDQTGDGGDGEEQGNGGRVRLVEEDQHIGAEGQEHLLARAVEHFQHVVLGVLAVEVEAALGGVRCALSLQAHGEYCAHSDQDRCQGEEEPVGLILRHDGEYKHHGGIARQGTDLTGSALYAQGCAAPVRLGVAHGQAALHAQLDVFAQAVHADGQGDEHLLRREGGMHAHTGQHDDGAGLVHGFGRAHVEHSQDEYQRDAGQLAEELCHAAVHLAHVDDLCQVVVQHTLVQAIAKPCDQDGKQQRQVTRACAEGSLDSVHECSFR